MRKPIALALLLVAAVSTPSSAQFGRLKNMVGKGDKPDSAKAVADSMAKVAADSGKGEEKKEGGSRFGGFLNKVMTKTVSAVAKVSGNMMTKSTADLTTVTPLIYRVSNVYPSSTGTIETTFIDNWGNGGDLVGLSFTQNGGAWLSKIDGTVTIDGKAADYATLGSYSAMMPTTSGPRTIEITTTTGQKSSFTLPVPKGSVKIASINGQAKPGSIDLSKDVTVEFENFDASDTTSLHVKIIASTLALKGFYDVGIFKPAARLVIPAAAFRNLNMAPGNNAVANFGDNYMSISRDRVEPVVNGTGLFAKEVVLTSVMDGRFFKASADPKLNGGITAKGDVGPLNYDVYKAHAFASRPLSQVKSIALTSLAIRGKSYFYKKTENRAQGTERTQEYKFRMSNAQLDHTLEELHAALIPIMQEEIAPVMSIDKTIASPSYKALTPFSNDDQNTEVVFSRSYRNLTLLSAIMPITAGFGPNRADAKILAETGASALMRLTLDLDVGEDGMIKPTLAFELTGQPHGPTSATKFFAGKITGKGVKIRNEEMRVDEVTRIPELAAAFRAALRDIKAKESANPDYTTVWSIQ